MRRKIVVNYSFRFSMLDDDQGVGEGQTLRGLAELDQRTVCEI